MTNVLTFPPTSKGLKSARTKHKLTLTQAVCALRAEASVDIAPNTLESWENGRIPGVSTYDAAAAYAKFAKDSEVSRHLGKNLLFNTIPTSSARDILDMSIEDVASLLGYSPSYWIKIEANSRFLSDEKKCLLESMLQDRFMELCDRRVV